MMETVKYLATRKLQFFQFQDHRIIALGDGKTVRRRGANKNLPEYFFTCPNIIF